ncbi:MAG: type II toxin-antitoxin system VapC family toxin [Verrucomicrobia bacterium]|nr:type II toxin-antitoxin system VapC family toxin [Verrucomicrobiota bacterium]MDA1069709.1 type II toxin-antitoxin system VapC family toxin [Verrucomicrobiota bacterium]
MTSEDKRLFVDTNILLTASDADRQHHVDCLKVIETSQSGEFSLFTNGQVFREYLVVATRPKLNNGLGMRPKSALSNLAEFRSCIHLLEENAFVVERLVSIIRKHNLSGKHIHDGNIAATMLEHGLQNLLTLNPADFKGIDGISMVNPAILSKRS